MATVFCDNPPLAACWPGIAESKKEYEKAMEQRPLLISFEYNFGFKSRIHDTFTQ
jgi:hypothetical protein